MIKSYTFRIFTLRFLFSLVFVSILIHSADLYARAGGGGGGDYGGGNGDGGDLIGIIIYILMMLPFPWNIITIGVILFFAYWGNKKAKQQTVLNQLPTYQITDRQKTVEKYVMENPTFDIDEFKSKVRRAFIQIQEAWMLKDMKNVRKYISDGMYQRMNIQFKMMNILEQKNIIENLLVKNIVIDKIEYDGKFDIIHIAIHASIVDRFISSKYPHLSKGGAEEFVEYWSFIKKRGITEKNLYNTQNCPKCGAELPHNAGDVSQCSFCKTYTNLGDYDWILSEITQAEDYINTSAKTSKESSLSTKINSLIQSDETFSIQNIEDKASNGYLQIITSKVLKDASIMRRFVSNTLYEKLQYFEPENMVFNRIFLNDVTLIGAYQNENQNTLAVAIKSSYQRVLLENERAVLIDPVMLTLTEIVLMSRDIQAKNAKGSLYAHVCPVCAGPLKDTSDIHCQYCGSELNSTKNEWIITAVLNVSEYRNYQNQYQDNIVAGIDIGKLDNLYDVRDYAFNNVLVVLAADRNFEMQEMEMAQKLAKKWGYQTERIQPMFEMAKNKSLVIRMPEDMKKRIKIFKLMNKAAAIDGMVSDEEKDLLESVKQQYRIDEV